MRISEDKTLSSPFSKAGEGVRSSTGKTTRSTKVRAQEGGQGFQREGGRFGG